MAHRFEGGRRVLVGHGDTDGSICCFDYDADAGTLMPAGKFASGSSTSFLAVHPDGRHLYTTQNRTNQLSALEWADIEDGGDKGASAGLRLLNQVDVPAAPGESASGPAYATVDGGGRFVLCADYRGHNAVVFALQPDG